LGFKYFALFWLALFLNGCLSRNPDAWNQLIVYNFTNDSLVLQITKKYLSEFPGSKNYLPPMHEYPLAIALHNSGMDMIRENWGKSGDTIEIYRNDTLLVKWGGPLRTMADSINHFYNENSWTLKLGGNNNEYAISTFTITNEDLK
jgi:hypothetical protein